MVFEIIILLIFGLVLLLDSIFDTAIFSQDLVVKYLGRKFERIFGAFVGVIMLIFSAFLFLYKNYLN